VSGEAHSRHKGQTQTLAALGARSRCHSDDAAGAERIFNALSEEGTVQIPIAETFWALRFGMVVDRFGVPWLINCEKRAA